jgi:HEAT repeats
MQFAMPPAADSGSWQARELDSGGEYLASYARLGSKGSYSKQKLKYLRVMGPKGLESRGAEAQTVISSRATFAMGSDGRLARLRLQEISGLNVSEQAAGSEPAFRIQVELSLELLEASTVASAALDRPLEDLLATDVVLAAAEGRSADQEGDRDLVAGATVASLIDDLSRLPKDASKDRAAIQARLAALLRSEPKSIGETITRIRGKDAESQLLIAALAGAGTPETQSALVDLALDASLDKGTKEQVLANVVALDEPSRETAERLRPLLSDPDPEVRAQAGLAIGATARKLGETDPEAASAATANLTRQVAQSTNEEEKLWAIRSLGNSGNPSALPPLTEALGSDATAMREAAAQSLRFIPGTEADRLISQTIASDSSEDVRSAALFAARFRESELVDGAVESSARSDASEAVRQRAIQTLGRRVRESNAPIETLAFVAENDVSAQNRESARRILDSLPPPSDP